MTMNSRKQKLEQLLPLEAEPPTFSKPCQITSKSNPITTHNSKKSATWCYALYYTTILIYLCKFLLLADHLCDLCSCLTVGNTLKQLLGHQALKVFFHIADPRTIMKVLNNKATWALFIVNVEIIVFHFVALTYAIYIRI